MSHCSMYKYSSNEDGFISCIVHRERCVEGMKADGWVATLDEVEPHKITDDQSSVIEDLKEEIANLQELVEAGISTVDELEAELKEVVKSTEKKDDSVKLRDKPKVNKGKK